jgi:hypothetical protein
LTFVFLKGFCSGKKVSLLFFGVDPGLSLAFAFYTFHNSLGGQPRFGRASLED